MWSANINIIIVYSSIDWSSSWLCDQQTEDINVYVISKL